MSNYDFPNTLATIAAKAQSRWQFLSPEQAVSFAWFSVDSVGDASIDDADLRKHFVLWMDAQYGETLPDWMV